MIGRLSAEKKVERRVKDSDDDPGRACPKSRRAGRSKVCLQKQESKNPRTVDLE